MFERSETYWARVTMAKTPKKRPEERAARLEREREFRALLERRRALDERLAADRRRSQAS